MVDIRLKIRGKRSNPKEWDLGTGKSRCPGNHSNRIEIRDQTRDKLSGETCD